MHHVNACNNLGAKLMLLVCLSKMLIYNLSIKQQAVRRRSNLFSVRCVVRLLLSYTTKTTHFTILWFLLWCNNKVPWHLKMSWWPTKWSTVCLRPQCLSPCVLLCNSRLSWYIKFFSFLIYKNILCCQEKKQTKKTRCSNSHIKQQTPVVFNTSSTLKLV